MVIINHNRGTALERYVINYCGGSLNQIYDLTNLALDSDVA